MSISSNMNTILETWQNIGNSVAFILEAIYCTSTLYIITMTVESAFKDLKQLLNPLQERLIQETDLSEQTKIKLLIEKVENERPLSGNGYFEISRETLTSIVGISITYLIILLQFRIA